MKQGWEMKKLGEVTTKIGSGSTPRGGNESYKSEGISLVRSMNVHDFEFRDKNLAFIDDQQAKELNNVTLEENDVLLNITGASVARCCVIPKAYLPARVNQHVAIIRAKKGIIDPLFLNLLLTSKYYKDQLLFTGEQGATRQAITQAQLKSFSIEFPKSLLEQQRIVSILEEAFAAIAKAKANAEQNLRNAKELFESYLQGVFENKGRGWEEKRLADLCTQITVGHVGTMANKYKETGIPFLRSQNIKPHRISLVDVVFIDEIFNKELKKSQLKPGDLAIVRTGYPGTAAVIPDSLKVSNCSDLVIVRVGNLIDPYYLCYFFNSTFGKLLVLGNLVGAAQKHFNVTAAKNVRIPVPSVAQQQEIIQQLDTLSVETKKLESIYQQKINSLEEMKKSILQKAFSGGMMSEL